MTTRQRFRCKFCVAVLPAWLPVAQAPNGAMLLDHLAQQRPNAATRDLDRMHRMGDIT